MKTSNRILLATLILTLLILTAIHIALFARLKSGNYTVIKDPMRAGFEEHVLNNVNYVMMDGLDNVDVIPADTLSLGLRRQDAGRVNYKVSGDTLLIQLDSSEITGQQHDYLPVQLSIPSVIPVEARACAINLNGARDSVKAATNTFILKQSILGFNRQQENYKQYWKQLSIVATDESNISLDPLSCIDSAVIQLTHSNLDDNRAIFQKLTITTDDNSKLSLTTSNLKKATLTIKP